MLLFGPLVELILAAGMCIMIARIASADDQPVALWTIVCLALCLAGFFLLPWPFLRVLLAGVLSFGGMVTYKAIKNR